MTFGLGEAGRDQLDQALQVAGDSGGQCGPCLAPVGKLHQRASQMHQQRHGIKPGAASLVQCSIQHGKRLFQRRTEVDTDAQGARLRTVLLHAKRHFQAVRQSIRFTLGAAVFQRIGRCAVLLKIDRAMLRPQHAQRLGLHRAGRFLHRRQQCRQPGHVHVATLNQIAQHRAAQVRGLGDSLGFGGSGQPVKLPDELVDAANLAGSLFRIQQQRHQGAEAVGRVPVRRGRAVGPPVLPIGIGRWKRLMQVGRKGGQGAMRIEVADCEDHAVKIGRVEVCQVASYPAPVNRDFRPGFYIGRSVVPQFQPGNLGDAVNGDLDHAAIGGGLDLDQPGSGRHERRGP